MKLAINQSRANHDVYQGTKESWILPKNEKIVTSTGNLKIFS